jgi:hypothetical protein
VHFLGHTLLPAVYSGHPSVAQAVEDSLRADPHSYMDSELHALAGIDHGPAMKDALLKSLTSSSFPHWAAHALATRWEDDEEARAALRVVLEGEPVRASYAAAAAVPVLGREAAVERLLALLALPRNGQRGIRADIIAIALAGIYRDEAGAPGTDAERVAAACLEQLAHPGDDYEATAESEIVAAMGATQAGPRPRPVHACQATDTSVSQATALAQDLEMALQNGGEHDLNLRTARLEMAIRPTPKANLQVSRLCPQ